MTIILEDVSEEQKQQIFRNLINQGVHLAPCLWDIVLSNGTFTFLQDDLVTLSLGLRGTHVRMVTFTDSPAVDLLRGLENTRVQHATFMQPPTLEVIKALKDTPIVIVELCQALPQRVSQGLKVMV